MRVVDHYTRPLADGRILCDVCPRVCKIGPGQRGLCYVRQNVDGHMVADDRRPVVGLLRRSDREEAAQSTSCPGRRFCRSARRAATSPAPSARTTRSPRAARSTRARSAPRRRRSPARRAELGCASVAFTYNDPVIFYEYAIDVAEACHARGIKTVAVTAGSIKPGPRAEFFRAIDAANVDLKAFTDRLLLAPHRLQSRAGARHAEIPPPRDRRLAGDHDAADPRRERFGERDRRADALGRPGTRRRDAAAFFRLPPRLPHARPAADAEGDARCAPARRAGRTA